MIEKVKFSNYKSLDMSNALTLPRFFVIVGDNGAGKTNFCDAFNFARDVLDMGLRKALFESRRGNFSNIVRGRKEDRKVEFQLVFRGPLTYQFTIGLSAKRGEPIILSETLKGRTAERRGRNTTYIERDQNSSQVYNQLTDSKENWGIEPDLLQLSRLTDESRFPVIRQIRDEMRSILILRTDPDILRRQEQIQREPILESNGTGLVSILDNADPAELVRLAEYLAEGDRLTEKIRLTSAEPGRKVISIQEKGAEELFQPDQISDGTLRLIALLAVITGMVPSVKTLIVEEPENGLHFSRLSRLVELSRARVRKDREAQIIFTTHSIPLLHHLDREEAMAIVRDPQNWSSKIMPPPEEKQWQQFREFSGSTLGDLYSTNLWPELNEKPIDPELFNIEEEV